MSIRAYVEELEKINVELKNLSAHRKKLNNRKKIIEENIKDFLRSEDQPGVKHRGIAYKLDDKEKRQPKKKNEQERHSLDVLEKYGISNAKQVLEEVIEARRGYLIPNEKLKIIKIKNKKKY